MRPTKLLVAREKKPLVPRVLVLWKDGEIDKLLREEQMIRLCNRLGGLIHLKQQTFFANLVMSGQISSSRYLSENNAGVGGGGMSCL